MDEIKKIFSKYSTKDVFQAHCDFLALEKIGIFPSGSIAINLFSDFKKVFKTISADRVHCEIMKYIIEKFSERTIF